MPALPPAAAHPTSHVALSGHADGLFELYLGLPPGGVFLFLRARPSGRVWNPELGSTGFSQLSPYMSPFNMLVFDNECFARPLTIGDQ